MNRTYVFDIDGTLTLVGDRVKCLQKDPPDWDEFYSRCGEDDPNTPVLDVLLSIQEHGEDAIYFLTGRRESCRKDTKIWLRENGIICYTGRLLMRRDGDTRHDTTVKPELLQSAGISTEDTTIFEDRASVVRKWRELGYTCFQVAEGDF